MNSTTQTIFITGGTSGIGKALVRIYLKRGKAVHTCGQSQASVDALKQEFEPYTHLLSVEKSDFSQEGEPSRWFALGMARWGKVDTLILNAGISMQALVLESEPQVLERIMRINFFSNVELIHQALPHLASTRGSIVGVSSIASMVGLPGRSAYGASKAALHRWMDSLRKEVLHLGIGVYIVSPGFVETDIRKKALDAKGKAVGSDGKAHKKIMTAEICATLIIKAIDQKKSLYAMHTWQTHLGVLLNRHFPRLADRLITPTYIVEGKLIQ